MPLFLGWILGLTLALTDRLLGPADRRFRLSPPIILSIVFFGDVIFGDVTCKVCAYL